MSEEKEPKIDIVNEDLKEKKTERSLGTQLTLELTGAAVFGAISIVIGLFLAPSIPRIPGWGMAIVDPISIIWVTCFLIFGARSGLLCTSIGAIGLIASDPTGWVGPIMKFTATITLIIVPILFLRLYRRDPEIENCQKLKKPKNYVVYGGLGIVARVLVMILMNILVFATIWASFFPYVNLGFLGLSNVQGLTALIIGVSLINTWQSLLDLGIPYLIIFLPGIDKLFEIL